MALSLGDAFLNFTAGAVERNNKIRDENVALALEDFKANKDLYQKIALDRYTRDSNKYDTEVEKMDSLKSVYSFISDNNLDKKSAATLILSNTMPNFKNLDVTNYCYNIRSVCLLLNWVVNGSIFRERRSVFVESNDSFPL